MGRRFQSRGTAPARGTPTPPGRRERFPLAGLKALVRNAELEPFPRGRLGSRIRSADIPHHHHHSPARAKLPSRGDGSAAGEPSGAPDPAPVLGSPLTCHARSGRPLLPAPLRSQVCLKRPPRPAALSHPLSLPASLPPSPSFPPAGWKKLAAPQAMESSAVPSSGGRGALTGGAGADRLRPLLVSASLRLLRTWASRGRVFLCVCPVLLTRLAPQPRDGAAPRKDVAR